MRSTFFGLEIGRKAVQAQQRALDVTGHNIANVNTPGFSRQQGILVTSYPESVPGLNRPPFQGLAGTGVRVEDILRMRNLFYDKQFRDQNIHLGNWEQRSELLSRLELFFNEGTETGLSAVYDLFWQSWQELNKTPESLTVRAIVRQRGDALASTINELYSQFKENRTELNQILSIKKDEINTLGQQLRDLNQQIQDLEIGGGLANDLRDRRDLLLDDLAKLVNIRVTEGKLGQVRVSIGDYDLVDGLHVNKLIIKAREEVVVETYLDDQGVRRQVRALEGGEDATWSSISTQYNAEPGQYIVQINDADGNYTVYRYWEDATATDLGRTWEEVGTGKLGEAFNKNGLAFTVSGSANEGDTWTFSLHKGTERGVIIHDLYWERTGEKLDVGVGGDLWGGEIAALLEARDQEIPYYLDQLDLLIYQTVRRVNELHRGGFGLVENQVIALHGEAEALNFSPATSATEATEVKVGRYLVQMNQDASAYTVYRYVDDLSPTARTGVWMPVGTADLGTEFEYGGFSLELDTASGLVKAEDCWTFTVAEEAGQARLGNQDFFNEVNLQNLSAILSMNQDLMGEDGLKRISASLEPDKPGNGDNALEIAQLKHALIMGEREATFNDFIRSTIGKLGVDTQEAKRMAVNQEMLLQQIDALRQAISSVSLDEEMTNMVMFEHAYNAAARLITTLDEMIDAIVNRMGLVGRG